MGHHIFFVMDDIRHYDLTILWHQVGLEVETIKISKDAMPEDKLRSARLPLSKVDGGDRQAINADKWWYMILLDRPLYNFFARG